MSALLLIVLALGAALRLFHLSTQSFWLDEASTAAYVSRGWNEAIFSEVHHPPGYYALLHTWVLLFGRSEASLRLPSAILGTATVFFVHGMARRLFPERRRVWLLASLAAAVSPYLIYISQEARSYSLLVCLSLAATNTLWDYLAADAGRRQDHRRNLVLYSALSTLLLYTHYFAVWLLLAHELWWIRWLVHDRPPNARREVVRWLASRAATAFAFAPWALFALRHPPPAPVRWMHSPFLVLPYTILRYLVGYGAVSSRRALLMEPLRQLVAEEGAVILTLVAPLMMIATVGIRAWLRESPRAPVPAGWYLATLLLLPWGALLALSPWVNLMHDRALGYQCVILLLLVARGVDALPEGLLRPCGGVVAATVGFSLIAYYADPGAVLLGYTLRHGKEQWREAAETVRKARADAVVFAPGYARIGYDVYDPGGGRVEIDASDVPGMCRLGNYGRIALVRSNDSKALRDAAITRLSATHHMVFERYFPNQVGIDVSLWSMAP